MHINLDIYRPYNISHVGPAIKGTSTILRNKILTVTSNKISVMIKALKSRVRFCLRSGPCPFKIILETCIS